MIKRIPVASRVEGVSKSFGGVRAVSNCHMTVAEGSITGLIGPNGSGKTTLFNVITGMAQADAGATYFRGRNPIPAREPGSADRALKDGQLMAQRHVFDGHCRGSASQGPNNAPKTDGKDHRHSRAHD